MRGSRIGWGARSAESERRRETRRRRRRREAHRRSQRLFSPKTKTRSQLCRSPLRALLLATSLRFTLLPDEMPSRAELSHRIANVNRGMLACWLAALRRPKPSQSGLAAFLTRSSRAARFCATRSRSFSLLYALVYPSPYALRTTAMSRSHHSVFGVQLYTATQDGRMALGQNARKSATRSPVSATVRALPVLFFTSARSSWPQSSTSRPSAARGPHSLWSTSTLQYNAVESVSRTCANVERERNADRALQRAGRHSHSSPHCSPGSPLFLLILSI